MIDEIIKKAKSENKKVYVYAHKFPDGDAINSSCAVVEYLKNQGIDAQYVVTKDIFQYDINIPSTRSVQENSISLILDTRESNYAENKFFTTSNPDDIFVIDHHEKSEGIKCIEEELNIPKKNVIRDSDYSSTCEILINEFDKEKLSPEISNFLLVGLLTDTAKLQYLKSNTLENVSKLLESGANHSQALGTLTKKLYLRNEVGLAKTFLHAKKFEIGNTFGLLLSINNKQANNLARTYGLRNVQKKIFKMLDIENCSFNCMYVETAPTQYEMEFRSSKGFGNLDVLDLATQLGGGGHYNASGCTYKSQNQSFGSINGMIIKKAQNIYSDKIKNYTTPKISMLDEKLKSILDNTNRLTTSITPEILSQVDSLIKQGANYDFAFPKIRTFERFMLENEILSRVPEDKLFTQMPSLSINLSNQDLSTLMQKYNASEKDILDIINVFSDISIESASISLPNGKKSYIDKDGNISFSDEVIKNKDKEDISL